MAETAPAAKVAVDVDQLGEASHSPSYSYDIFSLAQPQNACL